MDKEKALKGQQRQHQESPLGCISTSEYRPTLRVLALSDMREEVSL